MFLQSSSDGLMVRFFQLSLSLRNLSLDPNNGIGDLLKKPSMLFSESKVQMTFLPSLLRDVTSSMPEIYSRIINGHVDVFC